MVDDWCTLGRNGSDGRGRRLGGEGSSGGGAAGERDSGGGRGFLETSAALELGAVRMGRQSDRLARSSSETECSRDVEDCPVGCHVSGTRGAR